MSQAPPPVLGLCSGVRAPIIPGPGLQATLWGESPPHPSRGAHRQQGSGPPAWGSGQTFLQGVCTCDSLRCSFHAVGALPHLAPIQRPLTPWRPWGAAPSSQLSQRLGSERSPESPQITAHTKGLKERREVDQDRGAGCYWRGPQAGHRASAGQKWAQTSDGLGQIQRSSNCGTGVAEWAGAWLSGSASQGRLGPPGGDTPPP